MIFDISNTVDRGMNATVYVDGARVKAAIYANVLSGVVCCYQKGSDGYLKHDPATRKLKVRVLQGSVKVELEAIK